ncbi:N-terminal domain of NEFA-interacting nuclear protein NIP30-domain-containing protein [Podospora aff. communis PSN243]|uniref:N-terminal domain of NEFA-interacting nuclear protein NIP30-domain-containing protein n=1 Tax=Podospora aff. communis PSN243 TaxID=3040156 RepID=A0AAV9G9T2_9PEZI|nr:N-terminal domain of NEFA-interacting nuclear protein NIP30-domain-containing protein [Podospora aff. communis PSN243]
MSSRFVSAGAIDAATGESTQPPPTSTSSNTTSTSSKKSKEWLEVQAQLDAARAAKAAATADVGANGEKSLYDVLQANKAAKQAAFEEANKIKNQFRALDDDEIDFLEGVRERKREEEERVKRELEEGLKAFREGRAKGKEEGGGGEDESEDGLMEEEIAWASAGRKRRRVSRGEGKKRIRALGVVRRVSGAGDGKKVEEGKAEGVESKGGKISGVVEEKTTAAVTTGTVPVKKPGGLVDYGSSDDDDD